MINTLRQVVPAAGKSKKNASNRVVRRYTLPVDLPREVFPEFKGSLTPADLFTIPMPATITSMFAGCGGLDLGFEGNFRYMGETLPKLSFDVIAAYDKDETCVETYNKNFLVKEGEMPRANALDLAKLANIPLIPRADILIGGFPCQDFSSCGPRKGLSTARGRLYRAMIEYMRLKTPAIVVGENVPNLSKIQDGKALNTILEDIREVGYAATVWFLHAIDYGIPQDRIRVFIVAVRKDYAEVFGLPIAPAATHLNNFRTIEWAIGDLVSVKDEAIANQSQYFKASKAKNGNGQGDETNVTGFPAYTIRANAKSRIQFHYSLSRRLTIRECARLQTFPDDFVFPHSATRNLFQIGNAVPPLLGHNVAKSIQRYIGKLNSKIREARK